MRLAWLTDIHLNFLKPEELGAFIAHVMGQQPDAVLITGDIAEAPNLEAYLMLFEDSMKKFMPHCLIYYVLGNHDFYRSDIKTVRSGMEMLTIETDQLVWLQSAGVVELTPDVALVGHDGWCDARHGNFNRSIVRMGDFHGAPEQGFPHALIHDFIGLAHFELRTKLEKLGDEAGSYIRKFLPLAMEKYSHVIVMTHIPPFREVSTYRGAISDDNWAPFFTCKAFGDALLDVCPEYPDSEVTVLCGHTHSSAHARPLENLNVYAGHARYSKPTIQKILRLSGSEIEFEKPTRAKRKPKA